MVQDFQNILIIGPSSKRKGGIASVLSIYKQKFNAHYFDSTKFQSTILSFLFFPERLLSLCIFLYFNKKIEIVHIHGSSEGSFIRKYILYKICKFFNKKTIYHIHSGRFNDFYEQTNNILKPTIKGLINNADAIIVLSEYWLKYFKATFNPKKVEIVPNIVLEPLLESKKGINTPIKIVYLGKIFKAKGIYDLLDCIISNYDKYCGKATFFIAGNGEEDKTNEYKKLDKEGIIIFLGWINTKQKNELLQRADVLILPSYSEGLPISILEAMSYQMPIIATPVGGIPEVVQDGFNGKIIKQGNLKDIDKAINFYINNSIIIKTQGENSYKKVKQHFPKNVKTKLLKIYNDI